RRTERRIAAGGVRFVPPESRSSRQPRNGRAHSRACTGRTGAHSARDRLARAIASAPFHGRRVFRRNAVPVFLRLLARPRGRARRLDARLGDRDVSTDGSRIGELVYATHPSAGGVLPPWSVVWQIDEADRGAAQ